MEKYAPLLLLLLSVGVLASQANSDALVLFRPPPTASSAVRSREMAELMFAECRSGEYASTYGCHWVPTFVVNNQTPRNVYMNDTLGMCIIAGANKALATGVGTITTFILQTAVEKQIPTTTELTSAFGFVSKSAIVAHSGVLTALTGNFTIGLSLVVFATMVEVLLGKSQPGHKKWLCSDRFVNVVVKFCSSVVQFVSGALKIAGFNSQIVSIVIECTQTFVDYKRNKLDKLQASLKAFQVAIARIVAWFGPGLLGFKGTLAVVVGGVLFAFATFLTKKTSMTVTGVVSRWRNDSRRMIGTFPRLNGLNLG